MSNAIETRFIHTVSPEVRKALVINRLRAFRGHTEAFQSLEQLLKTTATDRSNDIVAIRMLWSELLYLDGRTEEGLKIFHEIISINSTSQSAMTQLVFEDNHTVLSMASTSADEISQGISAFYHLVDRRRTAQFQLSDPLDVIDAQDALIAHKYGDAHSPLWRNLAHAYSIGSWRESTRAARRYGNFCMEVGELEKASYYLIHSEDEMALQKLAEAIIRRRDTNLIRSVVAKVMAYSNLRKHFIVACKLLSKLHDIIPDDKVVSVTQWLLLRCKEAPVRNGGGVMLAAWTAIQEFGPRVPSDVSKRIIETAISHSVWQSYVPGENRVLLFRKEIIEAVIFLIHSAPVEYLPAVVEATLPLATDRMQGYDYSTAVELLCQLAELGGSELKSRIATVLYTPGKPPCRVLAQVNNYFGADAYSSEQLEVFAHRIIAETRLTVQKIKFGEVAKAVPDTLMTMTKPALWGQIQIIVQGDRGLEVLAKEKQKLSDATISQIVHVITEMATDQDNLLSNREILLYQLKNYTDGIDEYLREAVVRAIEPMARGEIILSDDYTYGTSFIRGGSVEEVQAIALVVLACYTSSARHISEALVDGFSHPSAIVRKGAYTAAGHLPNLSGEQIIPILMGLRDPEPTVAISAFTAFAKRDEWNLTRPLWKIFLLAVRFASQSPNTKLRRHAAFALRNRLKNATKAGIRIEAQSILDSFSTDVAYSVREAATATNS